MKMTGASAAASSLRSRGCNRQATQPASYPRRHVSALAAPRTVAAAAAAALMCHDGVCVRASRLCPGCSGCSTLYSSLHANIARRTQRARHRRVAPPHRVDTLRRAVRRMDAWCRYSRCHHRGQRRQRTARLAGTLPMPLTLSMLQDLSRGQAVPSAQRRCMRRMGGNRRATCLRAWSLSRSPSGRASRPTHRIGRRSTRFSIWVARLPPWEVMQTIMKSHPLAMTRRVTQFSCRRRHLGWSKWRWNRGRSGD